MSYAFTKAWRINSMRLVGSSGRYKRRICSRELPAINYKEDCLILEQVAVFSSNRHCGLDTVPRESSLPFGCTIRRKREGCVYIEAHCRIPMFILPLTL